MKESTEKFMTIKEYAEKMHISRQSVNSKINRHKEELKNHIFIINGRKMLDEFAQDLLKPTKDNALLISKNIELENTLNIEKFESRENKKLADGKEKKIANLIHELETKNRLFEEYVGIMKKMEQCIIEKILSFPKRINAYLSLQTRYLLSIILLKDLIGCLLFLRIMQI